MSWEWNACREGGNTVFACIIMRSIFHFESSVYKITDFKHSLSSCKNYFLYIFEHISAIDCFSVKFITPQPLFFPMQ